MRQTASPTRTAANRSAEPSHRPAASLLRGPVARLAAFITTRSSATPLRRLTALALLLLPLALAAPAAHAQAPMDFGMTFTQQRSKFVGDSPADNFYLRGATVDLAYSPFHGLGPVVSLNGLAVTNLRTQIDIHQASFLGGGRYTYSLGHVSPTIWSRRGSIFAEALVGLTHASSGYYPDGNTLDSTASGFSYAFGGGVNYTVYHRFELRLMSHYFVSDLPNGGTRQQRNLRFSAGVNWHFGN